MSSSRRFSPWPHLARAAKLAWDMLAPGRCRSCGASLFGRVRAVLCPDCLAMVQWIGRDVCRGCGFPAGPHAGTVDSCGHCRGKNLSLTTAAAVARYRRGARDIVLSLKYRLETELAGPMAELMAARLRACEPPAVDFVFPVPLHPARRRERGFNQSELLAAVVAARFGVPLDAEALLRVRWTLPQAALGRADRLVNIRGSFLAARDLSGKRVLLVDDVMTTGATMGECARTCRAAGAVRVHALTFAR